MTTMQDAQGLAPVLLSDIVNLSDLGLAVAGGYVRVQQHPTEPLVIYNYTERCQFAGEWTDTTRTCRGLIVHCETGEVVARPPAKFFNYGQSGAADIHLSDPVLVTDKADGSLGIIYAVPSGGWAVATRGSFASGQAVHATKVLHERYPNYRPTPGTTTVVEIVYPSNRIVLDYAGMDDLILIGAVGIFDGVIFPPSWVDGWDGPMVETIPAGTLAEALALPPRSNAEGVVVQSVRTGALLKIKQADYVALHRIVTGLNTRTVWQHLADGRPVEELAIGLPDEFHNWVRQVAGDLTAQYEHIHGGALSDFYNISAAVFGTEPFDTDVPPPAAVTRERRKAFAAQATMALRPGLLFALLDGRDIQAAIWAEIRPEAVTPTGNIYGEDVS